MLGGGSTSTGGKKNKYVNVGDIEMNSKNWNFLFCKQIFSRLKFIFVGFLNILNKYKY